MDEPCGDPGALRTGVLLVDPVTWAHLTSPEYPNREYVHVHLVTIELTGRCSLVYTNSPLVEPMRPGARRELVEVDAEFGAQADFWDLPLHRSGDAASVAACGTCDGSGCPDCTDPA